MTYSEAIAQLTAAFGEPRTIHIDQGSLSNVVWESGPFRLRYRLENGHNLRIFTIDGDTLISIKESSGAGIPALIESFVGLTMAYVDKIRALMAGKEDATAVVPTKAAGEECPGHGLHEWSVREGPVIVCEACGKEQPYNSLEHCPKCNWPHPPEIGDSRYVKGKPCPYCKHPQADDIASRVDGRMSKIGRVALSQGGGLNQAGGITFDAAYSGVGFDTGAGGMGNVFTVRRVGNGLEVLREDQMVYRSADDGGDDDGGAS